MTYRSTIHLTFSTTKRKCHATSLAGSIPYALETPSRVVATGYATNSAGEDARPSGLRGIECILPYLHYVWPLLTNEIIDTRYGCQLKLRALIALSNLVSSESYRHYKRRGSHIISSGGLTTSCIKAPTGAINVLFSNCLALLSTLSPTTIARAGTNSIRKLF